ncbi:MAG: hypothetical protein ACREXW_03670 [Gammaproteobacteria bacterium]
MALSKSLAKAKVKRKGSFQRLAPEKLTSLPDAHTFVKPGTTLAQLQANATQLEYC